MNRNCLPCTECCQGCIEAQIGNHHLKMGSPCPHVTDNGCGIGEARPEHPCRAFYCGWMSDEGIPETMRPDLSKALLISETYPGVDTLMATRQVIENDVKMHFAERARRLRRPLIIKEVMNGAMWVTPIGDNEFVNKINAMAQAGQRIE